MRTKIQKWGNSLAVRIPKSFAVQSDMEENSIVDLELAKGQIIMKLHSQKPQYSLEEMLDQVTDESVHPETDWGAPVGREAA